MKPALNIGAHQLKGRLLLAPMAGVTDLPFRRLCRRLGASLAVTEMVSANSLMWGSAKTRRRAAHDGEEGPVSVQIMGTEPAIMAEAARINVAEGADIIDINMGCPAKKICNTLAGSALLRDEVLVRNIVAAVVQAVNVPVTLKIRTGWDQQSRNALAIANIAQNEGIQMLSIHGRTRQCFYTGEAEYDTIAEVKSRSQIPIIANGDLTDPEKIKKVLDYTQADGAMIGRMAQGNPWIFEQTEHYLEHGEHCPPPSKKDIHDLLHEHVLSLYDFYGHDKGVMMARKHVGWYAKGLNGASHFRQRFNTLNNSEEQLQEMADFFQ